MDDLKVCIDLSNAFPERLLGLYNAYAERESNVVNEHYERIIGHNTVVEQSLIDAKNNQDFEKLLLSKEENRNLLTQLALWRGKLWENGKKLKVKFLGGDNFLHQNVIDNAKVWENFANISFEFVTVGDAELRVSFMPDKGSWSYVGTDALNIVDQSIPTINFGWFNRNTTLLEFSRTTIHEFGHALGCIHEHQSTAAAIPWNKEVVYDYYYRTQVPPWDRQKVDNNLFATFDQAVISNSEFDRQSIMLYPIPTAFTTKGFSVGMNNIL